MKYEGFGTLEVRNLPRGTIVFTGTEHETIILRPPYSTVSPIPFYVKKSLSPSSLYNKLDTSGHFRFVFFETQRIYHQ